MFIVNSTHRDAGMPAGLLSLVILSLVCGCTTTPPSSPLARLEVQEQVGFTITEEVRISNDVRVDYAEALRYLGRGQLAEGIQMLESVVATAPNLSAPRIDLGVAYHRAGDLEAAEKTLLSALQASPDHPIAHNELGIVYRKSGRFAEARRSYEAALAIYPGFHYARRNLAVLCDLYLVDLNCALNNYEAYMATVPSDEEAAMWIADIRMRMSQEEN